MYITHKTGFLLLHPVRFLTGKRWVRADRIGHLDALTFTEDTPVRRRGLEERITLANVAPTRRGGRWVARQNARR